MSSVGSDYSAHRRSIDELEKEYETSRKKAKQRETEREAKLERNYQKSIATTEKKAQAAIEDLRDTYEKSADQRRSLDHAQRDELKRDLYDRAGRSIQAAAADVQEQRDRIIKAADDAQEQYRRQTEELESYYSERASANEKRSAERLEKAIEDHREEVQNARTEGRDSQKTKDKEYKEKLQRETRQAIAESQDLVREERRKTSALTDGFKNEVAYREKKNQQQLEHRLQKQDQRIAHELEDAARSERLSRASETAELRGKLDEISRFKANQQGEWNRGRADAIRELESDWRGQMMNMSDSHARELEKTKDEGAEAEKRLAHLYNNALKDQGNRTATVISKQNLEHARQMSDTVFEYDRAKKQIESQAKHTVELQTAAAERQRQKLNEEKNEALTDQARIYQQAFTRQKVQDQSQIRNLERMLSDQATTDDPGRISSAAEAAIRKQMEEKYEKTFQAEAHRNDDRLDQMQRSFQKNLDDARKDNSFTTMKIKQQALIDQQNQQREFLSNLNDVQFAKEQQLNLSSQQQERTRDALIQMNERSQNELHRHYQDVAQTRDAENEYRINTVRQDAEFEKKAMRREFSIQTSDLIRNYEKQLTEQRTRYEDQLRDLRARTDAQVRDNEKRLRQALEQQERAFNQRVADTESQNRERERLMAQNHADELDKVKRANALLLSKKS